MNKILQMNIQNQKENCTPPTNNSIHSVSHNFLAFFLLFIIQITQLVTAQPVPANPGPITTKQSMAGVMTVVLILFFITCLLSLYTRNCSNRRTRIQGRLDLTFPIGSSWRCRREACGLNPEVIDSFPTFLYSRVKDIMIARETLACAVCLDEFKDTDTLRLIPTCSHVFHPSCIDAWLESHSTCPVCRANLVPKSEDASFVSIELPNNHDQEQHQLNNDDAVGDVVDDDVAYPKDNVLNRIPRSRSTGFLSEMFRRPGWTGDSIVVEPGLDCERYTLRLPDEMRKELLVNSTLKRTNSCMSFRRMSSGRRGYRTKSIGRNYLQCQHERFCSHDDFTTPFFNQNSSGDSGRKSPSLQC